jgi:hypothetical protein
MTIRRKALVTTKHPKPLKPMAAPLFDNILSRRSSYSVKFNLNI